MKQQTYRIGRRQDGSDAVQIKIRSRSGRSLTPETAARIYFRKFPDAHYVYQTSPAGNVRAGFSRGSVAAGAIPAERN